MQDGLLLQSVEGLGISPFKGTGGGTWNWLQSLKEEVSQELLAEGPLCQNEARSWGEHEAPETNGRELELRHRGHLEARLRDINDAQDRLLAGTYGKCADCGKQVDQGRLAADPATSLCLECRRIHTYRSNGDAS